MPRKIVWSPIQISDCPIFAVCASSLLYNTLLPSPHMLNSSKQQHLLSHSFHGLESGCDLAGFFWCRSLMRLHWRWGLQSHLMALLWEGLLSHSHVWWLGGLSSSWPVGLAASVSSQGPLIVHQDEQMRRARAEERGLVESLFSYSQGEEIIQQRDGGIRRQRSLGATYHTAWLQEGECLYFSFPRCKMG